MSTTIKQAIDGFLLSCKVEGKSYGTIDCYSDKLKGFLWYATNYDWPDDISPRRILNRPAMRSIMACGICSSILPHGARAFIPMGKRNGS